MNSYDSDVSLVPIFIPKRMCCMRVVSPKFAFWKAFVKVSTSMLWTKLFAVLLPQSASYFSILSTFFLWSFLRKILVIHYWGKKIAIFFKDSWYPIFVGFPSRHFWSYRNYLCFFLSVSKLSFTCKITIASSMTVNTFWHFIHLPTWQVIKKHN